jgi:GT2 family glycosyltransferase
VAFIDDDAVPERGWLSALTDVMRDTSVACAGGYVYTEGNRPIVHADAGRIRWYGQYVGNVASVEASRPFDVDSVMEGNSCWRTSVIRSLVFEPVLARDDASLYGLDLCLQAKAAGYRVFYTSAARIVHTPGPRHDGSSLARDAERMTRRSYGRNYTFIALKRLKGARRLAFMAWWWLVGERASYGVVTAVADLLTGRAKTAVVAASFGGKLEGVRAWRSGL